MDFLRLAAFHLPVPIVLGYCWTQAIIAAEFALGAVQGANTLGLMVILVVMPLALYFEAWYAYLIAVALRTHKYTQSARIRLAMLTLSQALGTGWGYVVLNLSEDVHPVSLGVGAAFALVSAGVGYLAFPRSTP